MHLIVSTGSNRLLLNNQIINSAWIKLINLAFNHLELHHQQWVINNHNWHIYSEFIGLDVYVWNIADSSRKISKEGQEEIDYYHCKTNSDN